MCVWVYQANTLPMYVRKDRHSQCMWRKPDVTSVCEGREVLPMYVKEARLWQCMWRKPDVASVCEGSKTFPVCVKEARRYQLCEGSQTRPELLFKLSSTPFWLHFYHINKRLYRKIKQYTLFAHSFPYYSFIHSFVHVFISTKTTDTIHYVSSTTKIKHYFNTITGMKQSFKPFSATVELFNPQYK